MAATVVLHVSQVVVRALALGRLPADSPLEFVSLLAVALIVIYAVIERWAKVPGTGFVVMALAFLLQFLASAFVGVRVPPRALLLDDPGYGVHILLVLLSYASLSLAFVYALLYLVQARQLSRKTFGLLFRRLPPLETLERMSVGSVQLGVPLLLASLVSGHIWMATLVKRLSPDIAASLSHGDPKIISSWILLIAYSIGLLGHRYFGWRGRRMNLMAIAGYVLMVAGIALVHHFFPSFHNFSTLGGV